MALTFRQAFPQAFKHYRPRSQKVFGVICITPEKKILIVRGRETGKWSFPKGHIEGSETSYECALRETFEETGISLPIERGIVTRKLYAGEYFIYRIQEVPTQTNDRDEITDVGWYSIEELQEFQCNADIMYFLSRLDRDAMDL
jgi:8-oxo-dGTP pyrophosphatase MutT (NUDIX family)